MNTIQRFIARIKLNVLYARCYHIQETIGNTKRGKCIGRDRDCKACKYYKDR